MAEITAGCLADAARALALAGQWARASSLLAAAAPDRAGERAVLAVAAAEVNVDQDFWCQTDGAAPALAHAASALAEATGPSRPDAGPGDLAFDLEFLRLRHDYFGELAGPDGPRFGPDGRAAGVIDDLASRAARLRAAAPDGGRAAAASFYAGLIEDNLRGDSAAAGALFAEALRDAEQAGDDMTVSEALRHLGYLAAQSGDTGRARRQWERSAELRQRAGAVPFVLSQHLLLADLARDTGDLAGGRALAREAGRWAHTLGIPWLEQEAASLTPDALYRYRATCRTRVCRIPRRRFVLAHHQSRARLAAHTQLHVPDSGLTPLAALPRAFSEGPIS